MVLRRGTRMALRIQNVRLRMIEAHKFLACAVIAAALFNPIFAAARGGGGHGHASNYCTICARDSHGRIARRGGILGGIIGGA